ncbi:DUF2306 domain-containing protein [Niveispirillum sp. KHB5.9]|uniref:DUF2306 domain-containing protein n=1 Tax=Niveispirillum sp. KHB5.9 TaxID=3400269 RepID=UPI003A854114
MTILVGDGNMVALSMDERPAGFAGTLLRLSARLLVAVTWGSAGLFGAYILAFYGGAMGDGTMERWNETLSGLYDPADPLSVLGIGVHFLMGGVLLLLGPVQLIGAVRGRWPRFHRWSGRAYVLAAFLTGLGGLGFILARGTIGGTPMDIGFGLYGVLVVLASVETFRHARARRMDIHRAWGIRLFALVTGSWLYRMDYGFWLMMMGKLGHASDFSGPFDITMAFFFYLPNLVVAEMFIRARGATAPGFVRVGAAAVLLVATGFVALGTFYFTKFYWGPPILARLGLV